MPDREGQRLGNYRLARLLGKGAFAEVYLGEHLYLNNYAAIKVLLKSLNEHDEQVFLSEAQTLAQLTHPNIVHIRDFAIDHGTPFLAMDYASGGTLRKRHPAHTSLSLQQTVSYVKQIAAALQYAHNHGIVHRDVKPENVLQGPEQLLLSDFGISLHLPSASPSGSQEWAGTLPYIAPEQVQGKAVYTSDQYSLAILAYEWLCGVRPFEGNALSLVYQHTLAAPPPLREHDSSLPAEVKKVVLKALSKRPEERYTSVITFARVLERAAQEDRGEQHTTQQTDGPEELGLANTRHIFLSAASGDHVSMLKADLESRNITVAEHLLAETASTNIDTGTSSTSVQDEEAETIGAQNEDAIRQAIRETQAIVLIVTPQTRSAVEVRTHLRIAGLYRRPILAFWMAGEPLPELLPPGAERAELIDARDLHYRHALDELVAFLERDSRNRASEAPRFDDQTFEPRNPYKGLQAFTRQDRGDFFGRDTLVQEMIGSLQKILFPPTTSIPASSLGLPGQRLLALVGPSGSGKSSVVMAGLLPRLQEGALPGSENWIYPEPIIPGKQPLEALAQSLAACFPGKDVQMVREMLNRESGLGLNQIALALGRQDNKMVVFIDQLEELFSVDIPEVERRRFINLLIQAAIEPGGPVVVLLTLRADLYDRPLAYANLGRLIQQNQCTVLPMEIEDLRTVIERPALLPDVRLVFEDDLVGDLLYDVRNQAGTLPLLEFTLSQLFAHRHNRQLTQRAYQEIGGVRGALSKHAEETYANLPSEEHRTLARILFTRLLQPGKDGQAPLRRRADLAEFTLEREQPTRLLRETIDAFLAARLLTTQTMGTTTMLEVGHETLLRAWPRLVQWAKEAGEDIRVQQNMSHDVTEWEQRGHPKDRLYRGSQLKETLAWHQRNPASEKEAAFLRASIARRKQGRIGLLAIVCLILVLLVPTSLFVRQRLAPLTVTTLQDSGPGSLRQIIGSAAPGSTIVFAPGLKGQLSMRAALEIATNNLTIRGPGAGILAISGVTSAVWSISIRQGVSVTISGLTFRQPGPAGGSFFTNNGSLTLDQCTFADITEVGQHITAQDKILVNPAAIENIQGTLTIQNSLITNNTVITGSSDLGDVYNEGGTVTVKNSQITNNTVRASGRGPFIVAPLINHNGKLTLIDSTITGNKTIGSGQAITSGGVHSEQGTLILTNSTVSNNSISSSDPAALEQAGGIRAVNNITMLTNSHVIGNSLLAHNGATGGGISTNGGSLTLVNSTVLKNSVSSDDSVTGGGINGSQSTLTLTNSQIASNTLTSNLQSAGGGISVANGPLTLDGCIITGNTIAASGVSGGGIFSVYGRLTINATTISNNTTRGAQKSSDGGGITDSDTLTISNSIVANNTLSSTSTVTGEAIGGGLFIAGTLNLSNTTISGNRIDDKKGGPLGGGAILIPQNTAGATLKLTNCTIFGNTAASDKGSLGGGIESEGARGTIDFCTIYGNTASAIGGGLAAGLISGMETPSSITLKNTLIAHNAAPTGPDLAGNFITNGYNLIQRFSGATWSDPTHKHSTDLSGDKLPNLGIDTQLRTSDKATPTLALLPGSPAIDRVPASACDQTADQRNMKRPQQNACDIGAYEYTS